MKHSPYSLLVLIFLLFFLNNNYAQGPGSLFVDAGLDTLIPCGTGGCADITADYLEIFETFSTNYTVAPIPYSPDVTSNPPFPFNGLANNMNPNQDDIWSVVETLPFDFCFFGSLEQLFQVGSNGLIRFDVGNSGDWNAWNFNEDLPNNTNPALGEGNIFTPVHDINPADSDSDEIGYEVLGTYPNRVLVVSFFSVPIYGCSDLRETHMAVLYEFSNVIEIYIQNKHVCVNHNGGNAALGIQNNDGDIAYVPPGRNTSDSPWTASREAWRFKPDGLETFAFEWLDSTGTVIGNTDTINVCPAGGSEIFTARVTYTNTCNGDVVVLEDDVLVTISTALSIPAGIPDDLILCDEIPNDGFAAFDLTLRDAQIINSQPDTFVTYYETDTDAEAGSNPLASPYTNTTPDFQTVFARLEVSSGLGLGCFDIVPLLLQVDAAPAITDPIDDLILCDEIPNDGFAAFDLTLRDAQIINSQPGTFVTYYQTEADAEAG
ncbi:MAG: hypothetical protein HOB16_09030, partial [Flavobacteriaceae bacterium]|nr:hypothetical protein [Flavobacteriaceae bacterium]